VGEAVRRELTTRAIAERAGVGVASLYRYFPDREAIVEEVIRREILPDLDRALLHQQLALLKGDPEAWSHFRRLALAERLRFLIDGVVRASRLLVARFGLEFPTRYRDQLPHALGIPPGGDPRLMWGAANRDPAEFESPDQVDLQRRVSRRHAAFGRGMHFCVGAPLARLEARIVLTELLERTRSITLDPAQPPRWVPSLQVRRHEQLPVQLVPR